MHGRISNVASTFASVKKRIESAKLLPGQALHHKERERSGGMRSARDTMATKLTVCRIQTQIHLDHLGQAMCSLPGRSSGGCCLLPCMKITRTSPVRTLLAQEKSACRGQFPYAYNRCVINTSSRRWQERRVNRDLSSVTHTRYSP